MDLVDDLGKIQLFDPLALPSIDRKDNQSGNFVNSEKASDDLLSTDATNSWRAPIYDEFPDNEPISIIGQHLDLTIASTPQGHFMYWKGLGPKNYSDTTHD